MLEKPVQLSNNLIQTTLSSSSSSFLVGLDLELRSTEPKRIFLTLIAMMYTPILAMDLLHHLRLNLLRQIRLNMMVSRHGILTTASIISHVHSDSKKKSTTSIET